jgi:hypothetical protein
MTDHASNSDHTTSKPTARRTRRQLLAGGTGAVAAVLAAEAIARPAPASAANGDALILGQFNNETTPTQITNMTDGDAGFLVVTKGAGIAMQGTGDSGPGLFGASTSDVGVVGSNGPDTGRPAVLGQSPSGTGVVGESFTGGGVRGRSGLHESSATSSGTGVHGVTDSDAAGAVWGENLAGGDGVRGSASTGNAMIGVSSGSGNGVVGGSAGGIGVLAVGSKTALKVQGPTAFSRSGVLTIKAGQSTAKKTGIALTAASFVLATIQGNVAGVYVQGVTLVAGSPGSFTIHLNKTVAAGLKVAWFALS